MADVKITDNSKQVLSKMEQAVARGLEMCGLVGEGYAKLKCPVYTGRLRNSISHAYDEGSKKAYIGTNTSYGPYVELGTRKQKAQPFLRPAATNHTAEYKGIMQSALKG